MGSLNGAFDGYGQIPSKGPACEPVAPKPSSQPSASIFLPKAPAGYQKHGKYGVTTPTIN